MADEQKTGAPAYKCNACGAKFRETQGHDCLKAAWERIRTLENRVIELAAELVTKVRR